MVSNYKIHRLPEVKSETGLSRSSIYLRISAGTFPEQINLGGRAVGWLASDIQAWIKSRLADSRLEG
jgi:prophage regulatory protein